MLIGVPKEIKEQEYRVGLAPAGAFALRHRGHDVVVERGAGARVGFPDAEYEGVGARIVAEPQAVWAADLVVKVKELQETEFGFPHLGQALFAYLHLAPDPSLLDALLRSGVAGIAYETVADSSGGLPLLAPMSRIAGKLAVQVGAWALQMANGGSGVLLGGVPGVVPAKVVVIGAGAAGANAVRMAVGYGADTTVFDINTTTLAHLEELYQGRVKTCYSEPLTLGRHVADADLAIGATLTPGKLAPKLITRQHFAPNAVRIGIGGYIDRSGRHRGNLASHVAHPPNLRRRGSRALLRHQHAVRSRAHRDSSAHAGHAALHPRIGGPGVERCARPRCGTQIGLQVHSGQVTHQGLAEDVRRPFVSYDQIAARMRRA